MGQSNFIAAALFIAFFVYITAKGSLKNYLALLGGETGFSADTSAGSTISGAVKSNDAKDGEAAAAAPKGAEAILGTATAIAGPLSILGGIVSGGVGGAADQALDAANGGLSLFGDLKGVVTKLGGLF